MYLFQVLGRYVIGNLVQRIMMRRPVCIYLYWDILCF